MNNILFLELRFIFRLTYTINYRDATKNTNTSWLSPPTSNVNPSDPSSRGESVKAVTETIAEFNNAEAKKQQFSANGHTHDNNSKTDQDKEGKKEIENKSVPVGKTCQSKLKGKVKSVINVSKVELKILKMFIFITLLFLISYTPSMFILFSLFDSFYVSYFCFVNHFGNAFIYFYLDVSFRQDVMRIMKKILCCKK